MNPTDQKTISDRVNKFIIATLLILISIATVAYSVVAWRGIFGAKGGDMTEQARILTEEEKVNVIQNLGPSQNVSDQKALDTLNSLEDSKVNFTNTQKEDILKSL